MSTTEINTLSAILSANGDRVTVEPCAEGAIVRGSWSAGPTDALEAALSAAAMRVDALRSDELGLTVAIIENADGDVTGYEGAVFYRMSATTA